MLLKWSKFRRENAGQRSPVQLPQQCWPLRASTRDDQNVCSLFHSGNTLTLLPGFEVLRSAVCSPSRDLTSLPRWRKLSFQLEHRIYSFFHCLVWFSREDAGNVLLLKQCAWSQAAGFHMVLLFSLAAESLRWVLMRDDAHNKDG